MDISERRLHQQRIAASSFDHPAQVVEWLGAVQAQDFPASLWALGLRVRNGAEAQIEQAIAQRAIVRTWPMRGTLHFVPAQDARWMLQLLTPRVITSSAGRYRQLELDDKVFARCRQLIVKALRGDRQLTRSAVYEVLERAGISTKDSRGLHILGHLAQNGVICFAARQGKQPAFALLDEWVPRSRELAREEALAELAHRYFRSHGPATLHDFAWWSGLNLSAVKAAVGGAGAQLVQENIGGGTYWSSSDSVATPANPPRAHLLPSYDEYTVAYRDRSAVVAADHTARLSAGGILYPAIVVDARVVGTWRRTLGKHDVAISLQPFSSLNRSQLRAVNDAAARYAAFLSRDLAGVRVAVAN